MKTIIENIVFDGFCPACKLMGRKVEMRLNDMDFFECWTCHLQMTVFSQAAAVLAWKGEGKFRTSETLASSGLIGQTIYAASRHKGKEIFPDETEPLNNSFDLEAYVENIYESRGEYQEGQLNENDPALKEQELYLETVADEEWENLLGLYREVQKDGLEGDAFQEFHRMLYALKLVFSFPWMKWKEGQTRVDDADSDYSISSILQISMLLTTIFRKDHFDNVSIHHAYENGTLDKIMHRLEELT